MTDPIQFYGTEPEWENKKFTDEIERDCAIIKALNWYNYVTTDAQSKKWLIEYMESANHSKNNLKSIVNLDPKQLIIRYGDISGMLGLNPGIIARLFYLKAPLPDVYKTRLDKAINYLIAKSNNTAQPIQSSVPKINVQEFINEKCSEINGKIDSIMDSISSRGNFNEKEFKVYLDSMDLKAIHFSKIMAHIRSSYKDFIENENKEGYSADVFKESKKIIKTMLDMIEKLNDQYKTTHIVVRRKRTRPAADVVKNLNYQKEETSLNLQSISPPKIVGADKLVVYNTKYRTVTLFESSTQYGLSVKRSKITQFDEKKSKTKKVRKPTEFFNQIRGKGIRVFKSAFDELTTTETAAKGRLTPEHIIFEVY